MASEALWKLFEEWTQYFDEASIKKNFNELALIRHYLISTEKTARKVVELGATKKAGESWCPANQRYERGREVREGRPRETISSLCQ